MGFPVPQEGLAIRSSWRAACTLKAWVLYSLQQEDGPELTSGLSLMVTARDIEVPLLSAQCLVVSAAQRHPDPRSQLGSWQWGPASPFLAPFPGGECRGGVGVGTEEQSPALCSVTSYPCSGFLPLLIGWPRWAVWVRGGLKAPSLPMLLLARFGPAGSARRGQRRKLCSCRVRKCLRGCARAGAKGRILCDQGVWAEQGEGQDFSPE